MCNQCDTNKYIAIEAVLSKHDEEVIGELVTSIQKVKMLHKPINGPYDDLACDHCTYIMRLYRPDAPEDVYVGFPCKTIKALDGEKDVSRLRY